MSNKNFLSACPIVLASGLIGTKPGVFGSFWAPDVLRDPSWMLIFDFFIGNRSWKTTVSSQVTVFFLHVTTRTVGFSPCIAPRQGGDGWIQVSDPFWTSGSDWHLEPESKRAKLAWKITANLTKLLRQLNFLSNNPAWKIGVILLRYVKLMPQWRLHQRGLLVETSHGQKSWLSCFDE